MHHTELASGDIVFYSTAKDLANPPNINRHTALVTHVSPSLVQVAHITNEGLFIGSIGTRKQKILIPYRLDVPLKGFALKIVEIARKWVNSNPFYVKSINSHRGGVPDVFGGRLSIAFRSHHFGPNAQHYAQYLNEACQNTPPKQLMPEGVFFPGQICAFLPVAVYQAALPLSYSCLHMALDAIGTSPASLEKYLIRNLNWTNLPYVKYGGRS